MNTDAYITDLQQQCGVFDEPPHDDEEEEQEEMQIAESEK